MRSGDGRPFYTMRLMRGRPLSANIMLGAFGETQVVDWGLARRLADDPAGELRTTGADADRELDLDATRVGMVLGTPAYMSPEQPDPGVALRLRALRAPRCW